MFLFQLSFCFLALKESFSSIFSDLFYLFSVNTTWRWFMSGQKKLEQKIEVGPISTSIYFWMGPNWESQKSGMIICYIFFHFDNGEKKCSKFSFSIIKLKDIFPFFLQSWKNHLSWEIFDDELWSHLTKRFSSFLKILSLR